MLTKRTLMIGFAIGCVAACSVYWLHQINRTMSAREGVLVSDSTSPKPKTSFYLNMEQGFEKVRAESFTIPFSLDTVEWRSEGHSAQISVQLTQSAESHKDAGYCVEILANEKRTLIWWGHNLRLKLAPDLPPDQAAVIDLSQNAVVGYGKVEFAGDTISIALAEPLQSVETVYLRFTPSQQAFKQSDDSVEIVSVVRSQPAPAWGARVRSVQGGYIWHPEAY
jgi:hypothetical protein